jgi:hypothetical protein
MRLMHLLLIILLAALLCGALPLFPYSRGYGWGPSGFLGVLLAVLVILLLMNRI